MRAVRSAGILSAARLDGGTPTLHFPSPASHTSTLQQLSGLAALLGTLLLGGCASTSAPTANERTHVGAVEVTHQDRASAAGFADTLRETVIREAAPYGCAGRPITLRIALTRMHFKNVLQTLVIGDNNYVYGQVAVIDPATGQQISAFPIKVDDRRGVTAGSVAMSVMRMADPVGVMNVVGAVSINHSATAAAMSDNFAAATLRHTYGDAKAKAVANERKAQAKAR